MASPFSPWSAGRPLLREEVAMLSVMSLWLPVLVSAVLVFIVSSIIHMVLTYHRSDFGKVPAEDEVMDALRGFEIPPGEYAMPRAESTKEMGTPEYVEKATKGPVLFMTVLKSGAPNMGPSLIQWFVYCLFIGFFAAYITSRAVGPDPHYLTIFRFAGAASFAGYSLALIQNSIWYKRAWSTTFKTMFDGFVYALVTAGVFGWLWPR